MNRTETQYLYCLLENNVDDFITTSFTFESTKIEIFNFKNEFDPKDIKYVSIDYTFNLSFDRKYQNSKDIEYFEVSLVNCDSDREIITLSIKYKVSEFDVKNQKRYIKINSIIKD